EPGRTSRRGAVPLRTRKVNRHFFFRFTAANRSDNGRRKPGSTFPPSSVSPGPIRFGFLPRGYTAADSVGGSITQISFVPSSKSSAILRSISAAVFDGLSTSTASAGTTPQIASVGSSSSGNSDHGTKLTSG